MKPLKVITLLLVMVPALATIQAKPKKPYKLPAAFDQARYVYVEAEDGQEFDPRLDPDDRDAIADVDKALYEWNRYIVTTRRDQADLIFVVRKGRLALQRLGDRSVPHRREFPAAPPMVRFPAMASLLAAKWGRPMISLRCTCPTQTKLAEHCSGSAPSPMASTHPSSLSSNN